MEQFELLCHPESLQRRMVTEGCSEWCHQSPHTQTHLRSFMWPKLDSTPEAEVCVLVPAGVAFA